VPSDHIYTADADIFSPCALGGTLNKDTIPRLTAQVVAGAANNPLLVIFSRGQAEGIPPESIALRMAQERLSGAPG
jgi:glutamate dehydrogenase/leucine dehydrogenase